MSKLALLLVGKKGFEVLKDLIDLEGLTLLTDVVCSRDAGVDNDFYQDICELCIRNEIIFHDRLKKTFTPTAYDGYILAIGWKWMLPTSQKVLVIHDSILPKYRGFAPLVNSLISGEKEIGATALFAADEYDKGSVIIQSSQAINYPIKIAEAINLMSQIYIKITRELIATINAGKELQGREQDVSKTTYSLWRDDEDYKIDWSWDSEKIKRFIDAVGEPYAGARVLIGENLAIINSAELVEDVHINDRTSAIGKVIFMDGSYPVIVCGTGLLKVTDIRSSDGKSFLPLHKFRTRFNGFK